MSDSLRDRMLRELARHYGGWIDNGKPDSPGRICDDCEWEWPCPTARLIYREDEL